MKKILFLMMAAVAVGFTSCKNSAKQNAEAFEQGYDEALFESETENTISALQAQLEAGDVNKFQEVLESVKAKVAEIVKSNPEIAKEYVAKVQDFLKENTDKVKELVGDNAAVAAAVSALTEVEPASVVDGLLQSVDKAADNVKEAADNAKDAAVDAVNEKVDETKAAAEQKAQEAQDAAKAKANEAIDNAADKTKKALGL